MFKLFVCEIHSLTYYLCHKFITLKFKFLDNQAEIIKICGFKFKFFKKAWKKKVKAHDNERALRENAQGKNMKM